MIEDRADPRSNRRGRHHDRNRTRRQPSFVEDSVRQIVVIVDESVSMQSMLAVGDHLKRVFAAALVIWDRRSEADRSTTRPGLMSEVSVVQADDRGDEELCRLVRGADLVLVHANNGKCREKREAMSRLAKKTGRPWLVIPTMAICGAIGLRVAVFWDGTRHAARALSDALPLMRDAEKILVLDEAAGAGDAVAFLERHDYEAFVTPCDVEDLKNERIDLIVCGAGADLFSGGSASHGEMIADQLDAALLLSF